MPSGVELAMLRGEVMTSLASIQGDIRLVLQAQQAAARRTDDLQADVRRLDDRVDHIDRTAVTREELDQRDARLRAEAAEQRAADQKRADRRLTITGLLITVVFGVITAGVAVIAIIAK